MINVRDPQMPPKEKLPYIMKVVLVYPFAQSDMEN